MGVACQLVTGRVTNPSSTFTALTANTGDSFTVNNFNTTAPAYLDNMWMHEATPGVFRVRSPRLHDQSQGIRMQVGNTAPQLLLPDSTEQVLYPADVLTVEATGGAAETEVGALLIYYTDLPGAMARLAQWAEISNRIKNLAGVEVDVTTSATAGQWSSGTAINATFDNLQANADYALLGYVTDTSVGAVAISGPDTSNYRIGGPGNTDQKQTRQFFVDMGDASGRPYIPIINSNNRGGTLLYVADPATSTAVHVSLILAELNS